jgi:hypothetical protein
VKQYHLASRACIIQKTMVVLLHFHTGTEGRIINPSTGSLAEDPKVGTNLPIRSTELSAGTCTHTNGHTNTVHTRAVWLECCSTPNRNVIAEEASQSREKPLRHREESRWRRTRAPFGGRLSYCVSFMQQGKVQESVAPPPQIVPSLHFPSIAPECRPTIKCLREVMESVPGSFNELSA